MRKEPWQFIERTIFGTTSPEQVDGPKMLVVTGIGGCGKTQIILKFLWVHEEKFASRFFIDGSSEARIRADLVRHVRSLGIEHSQKTFEECLLFLSQPFPHGSRIIVDDNVDDEELDILSLIPRGTGCIIIFTSRNRSLGDLCPENHLELDKMSVDEAVELLLFGRGGFDQITSTTREEALEVALALEYLPIALQQARSYIHQTQCPFRAYNERLRQSREKLLAHPLIYRHERRNISTHAAFDSSFGRLKRQEQQFLQLISHVHWRDFPLELVTLAALHTFSEYFWELVDHENEFYSGKALLEEIFLSDGEWRVTNLDDIIIGCKNYSLVTVVPGVATTLLQVHPLFHEWVHSRIPMQDQPQYQSAAVLLLALGAREDHTPSLQYLESHLTHLSHAWDRLSINNTAAFGHILRKRGLFHESLQLQERLVLMLKERMNPEAGELLDAKNLLSITYRSLGRLDDAKELDEEVLKTRTEVLGKDHPDTISASSTLAITYHHLGRLDEALQLEEVLKKRKELLGEHHPETVTAFHNLATIYHDLRRLDEALQLKEEVLKLNKEVLGEHHPETIMSSNNLANTYYRLGRLDEALQLQEEALRLMVEISGKQHPDTITASCNLANIYHALGRLEEALQLEEEMLKLRTEVLGKPHPDTIMAYINLATTYHGLGRLEEALQLQEEVLKLGREVWGKHNPRSMMASSNLAATYRDLGRLDEALQCQEEVLNMSTEVLGKRHPDTITASHNLAATYCSLGRLEEALQLQEEVLRLRKEVLGKHHPDIVWAMLNLAATYEALEDLMLAMQLLTEADLIISKTQGTRHPSYTMYQEAMSRVSALVSQSTSATSATPETAPPSLGGLNPLNPHKARSTA